MKVSTFSLIIVCALLICSCKSSKRTMQKDSGSTMVEEVMETPKIVVRTESVKPVDQPDRTMNRYYVIIGSFKSLDNARKYNADMAKKGFTSEILENENGLYRISVGGFDDENAARARIAGIRAMYKEEHSDVWLLVRK